MKALLAAFFLLSFSLGTQAGGVTSGGGYGVFCYADQTHQKLESIQLLDFYKAGIGMKDFKLLPLPEGADVFEKAKAVIARAKPFSPDMVIDWNEAVDDFKNGGMNIFERGEIKDIDDGQTPVNPEKNCVKKQMAVQFNEPEFGTYRLLVDGAMWRLLDEYTKVGLIVHEAIYRMAMDQEHENANKVHILTAMLFSEKVLTLSQNDWLKAFKDLKIDGCFEKEFRFVNHDTGEVITHRWDLKIMSYDPIMEDGISCTEDVVEDFLGSYAPGILMLMTGSRISLASGDLCISASKDPDYFGLNLVYSQNEQNFHGEVCFSDELFTNHSALISSEMSNLGLNLKTIDSVNIESCEQQEWDSFRLTGCARLGGSLTLLGTDYELQSFKIRRNVEEYTLKEKLITIFLSGKRLQLRGRFEVSSDGTMSFFPYHNAGQPQLASFSGKSCKLNPDNVLQFNSRGSFLKVIDNRDDELAADDCAALFR